MRAGLLAACLLAACSGEPRSKPAPVAAGARQPVAPAPAQPPAPLVEPASVPQPSAAWRSADAAALRSNVAVAGLGQLLATGPDAHAAIDLPNAARVRLEPDTRIVVLGFEPCSVVLVHGSVFVELLPQGNQPGRAELRVISALGSVIVSNTAEFWLAQRSWPEPEASRVVTVQSQVILLRGMAELAQHDPRSGVRTQPLAPGQVLALGKPVKPQGSSIGLEEARSASGEFLRQKRNPARLRLASEALQRAWDASNAHDLTAEALLARMATLRNASAVPDAGSVARDAGDVRAMQRELASHAQQKHRLRQAFLLAAEQGVSTQFAACDAAGAEHCPALQGFVGQFSTALSRLH